MCYIQLWMNYVTQTPIIMTMTDRWKQAEAEAARLTTQEIFTHTVKNALLVEGATPEEKISFAMGSLPFVRQIAAQFVFDVASSLRKQGVISTDLHSAIAVNLMDSIGSF